MMKIKLLSAFAAAAVAFAPLASSAQSSFYSTSYKQRNSGSFNKGANLLSLGLGFGNTYTWGLNGWGTSSFTMPSIHAKYEAGIMDEIGLGGTISAGFGQYKNGNYKATHYATSASFLGYYHFNKLIPVSKLDVYAGVGLSLRIRSWEDRIINNNNGYYERETKMNVFPIGVVGARWYFTPTFAVYAESGYDGIASANLGVTFRLK